MRGRRRRTSGERGREGGVFVIEGGLEEIFELGEEEEMLKRE